MWTSCTILFTTVLIMNVETDDSRVKQITDIVFGVQRHLYSGCVSLLLSSAPEENTSSLRLIKLLSARGIASVTLSVPMLNISRDDAECRYNRPLYVVTQGETLRLKQFAATMSLTGPTWLLFSNQSVTLESLLTDVYIPFDCLFLVAREDQKGKVTLLEVYRVNRTTPLLSLQLALWSPKFGLMWNKKSFYERRNNMHGVTLKVSAYQSPPLTELKHNVHKLEIGGMFGEVWYSLSRELNYTTDVHSPEDNAMGASSKNGTWNGIIRMLMDQVVDVAVADVTMTSRRAVVIDFSVPLILGRSCIFIRTPGSSYEALNNILAPFSSGLWFTILGAILLLAAFLSLSYHAVRSYDNTEKPDLYTVPMALFCVFEIFCQQGHDETPRSLSCRLVYWVSHVAAVVLYAAYSGALISSLALQRIVPPFRTFSGLLQHGGYQVATLASSAQFNIFDETTDETMSDIYKKLFDKSMPSTVLEGFSNLCSRSNYAFLATYSSSLPILGSLNCSVTLQQLRDTGILRRIRNSVFSIEIEESETPWTSVSLDAVTPMFIILIIGITLATLLMFLERQTVSLLQLSGKGHKAK
ncbi:hypothetical protein B7P43_G12192 [Cryptotermes secundus]|uniref:Ionotropic glutamate receptor L-glutamate and glycine-binding domain-containing protein n=1 Tax=Cryptotermes secundus TaxID=105785 RepID=A0A2J7QT12_9NEOP|nr:hypothetical protein B7P43_G12192 [Cryptotermes secundus]